jgi:hypothetical protein
MNTPKSLAPADDTGWRYCYECTSAQGSRLATRSEAEAYFWYLLGYEIRRMLERAS